MTGYADPELLVVGWLKTRLDAGVKVWANPTLPYGWQFDAPLVHVQRGQDIAEPALSLDIALLDIETYSAEPDNARALADQIRGLMRLELPLTTFANGVFCKAVTTVSAPTWAPFRDPAASNRSGTSPTVARRSAAYRVILHGFVTG